MIFALFESMTTKEADALLHGFLESGKPAIEAIRRVSSETGGILLDYRFDTLSESLKWFVRQVSGKNVPVSSSEPEWVRKAHKHGFFELEDKCKVIVSNAAFYLGETFVQMNEELNWGIGNPESIQRNFPVVTGFQRHHELAPLLVIENVFLKILGDGVPLGAVAPFPEFRRLF
jgi:hypothetical protein